jgi:ABC-type multidrug transport system fused ATPase/permease subunit
MPLIYVASGSLPRRCAWLPRTAARTAEPTPRSTTTLRHRDKAFTREDIEAVRIGKHIVRYLNSNLTALRMLSIFEPSVEFSSALGTIVVIYFGGRLAFQQVLPIQDLVAFFLYLEMFYQPVRALSGVWEQIQEALAGADRVDELLRQEPEVSDQSRAITLKDKAQGAISLRDVSFYISE